MSIWAKAAIVFLCAAICALSVIPIARLQEMRQRQKQPATPVLLREQQQARWLLV